jgi:hypothetical protein
MFEEFDTFKRQAANAGEGLGTVIQVIAFALRPKVFAICLVVLLFIGISRDATAPLLLPLSGVLFWFGLWFRLKDR